MKSFFKPYQTRVFIWLGLGVLGVSLGAFLESGGDPGLDEILLRNISIAGIVVAVLYLRSWVDTRVENGWISWGCGFGLLLVIGILSRPWLGL